MERERTTVVIPEPLATEIRTAVDAWGREADIIKLRSARDAGKAGGLHGTLDFDALRDEARDRLDLTDLR